jgi:hypothetical protein
MIVLLDEPGGVESRRRDGGVPRGSALEARCHYEQRSDGGPVRCTHADHPLAERPASTLVSGQARLPGLNRQLRQKPAVRGRIVVDRLADRKGSILVVDDDGAGEEVLQGPPPVIDQHRQEAREQEKD